MSYKTREKLFNNIFNKKGYNNPEKLGYIMKMLRELQPLTQREWEQWYIHNIHDYEYIEKIAMHMLNDMSNITRFVTFDDCYSYIIDVIFRRSFNGYNKEKQALKILREYISSNVMEAPADWDTKYFIDFYIKDSNKIIGIQLKPNTFYLGEYQKKVDISGKMKQFCNDYNAETFVLTYVPNKEKGKITFSNPEIIEEIKNKLTEAKLCS